MSVNFPDFCKTSLSGAYAYETVLGLARVEACFERCTGLFAVYIVRDMYNSRAHTISLQLLIVFKIYPSRFGRFGRFSQG